MSAILYLAFVASSGQQVYVDSGGYYYGSTPYYSTWSGPGWSRGYWGPSRWFGWSPLRGGRYDTDSNPAYGYPVSAYGAPVYGDGVGGVYSDPCRAVSGGTDTAYDTDGQYSTAHPDLGERVHQVQMIQGVGFEPGMLRINVGDTVEWRNNSQDTHTVTFDPARAAEAAHVSLPEGVEPFDSGELAPGETFSHTFGTAGVYHYVCRPHEDHGMIGTIVVRDPSAEQGGPPAPAEEEPVPRRAADDEGLEELPLAEPPADELY